jgi:hypothetical protein
VSLDGIIEGVPFRLAGLFSKERKIAELDEAFGLGLRIVVLGKKET